MQPAPRSRRPALHPLRWLVRLHPLHSWLLVMAVIIGLSAVGARSLALVVAVVWLGFAVYTWVAPSVRGVLRRRR